MNHWETIIGSRPTTKLEFAQAMFSLADGVLLRIRHHVEKAEFHLSEQLDRNTGEQLSAKDLTWSYAEVLKAMSKRKTLEELMTKEEEVTKEVKFCCADSDSSFACLKKMFSFYFWNKK